MDLFIAHKFVMGTVARVITPAKDGPSQIIFTNGARVGCSRFSSDLIGKKIIYWCEPNGYDGAEEIEVVNEGQTVRFVRHLGGEMGFGIEFQSREVPLDILTFFGMTTLSTKRTAKAA